MRNQTFSQNYKATLARPINSWCFYRFMRRSAEIVLSALGCLLLLWLIPLIWVANCIFSPGPLFYWQTRVGQYGCVFWMVKFRSMVVNAETSGAVWASTNDPRITHVGHFLRKTHLDELPQVWHVLKGEMSLIGPRPERPQFITELAKALPLYQRRHIIKPGITGWAQVNYRYGNSVEDAGTKLVYDLYYLQHQSLWLDWQICQQTVRTIFAKSGR